MMSRRARAWRPGVLKAAALGLAVAGLSACANPQADQALYAQQAFVGMPKQTLLSCAGVPDRQAVMDNLEYYTYNSQRITSTTTPSPRFGLGYGHGFGYHPWYGYGGFGWPETTEIESRDCQATFTLKNGTVQQLVYGGASDGPSGRLGQCYRIVENCLALIPQQAQPAAATR